MDQILTSSMRLSSNATWPKRSTAAANYIFMAESNFKNNYHVFSPYEYKFYIVLAFICIQLIFYSYANLNNGQFINAHSTSLCVLVSVSVCVCVDHFLALIVGHKCVSSAVV